MRGSKGFSLTGTLIAITVAGIVLAAMIGATIHQQRFYLVTEDVAETVGVVQSVETVLVPELLPINPAAGDIVFAGTDSLVVRAFRGVFAVCDKQVASDVLITVWGVSAAAAPQDADSARIYSRGSLAGLSDNHWKSLRIASLQADTCPDGTPAWTLVVNDLSGPLSEIPVGAPVRLYRHARYWLETRGGGWYLKTDALDGSPAVVTGPLVPADSSAAAALAFRYLDRDGDPAGALTAIAQVEIETSALGDVPVLREGVPHRENKLISVKARNAE